MAKKKKKTLVSGVNRLIIHIIRNSGERITSAKNDAKISNNLLNLIGASHFLKKDFIIKIPFQNAARHIFCS